MLAPAVLDSPGQQDNSTNESPVHSGVEASINGAKETVNSQVNLFNPGISTSFSTSLPSQNVHGDDTGDDEQEGQQIDCTS